MKKFKSLLLDVKMNINRFVTNLLSKNVRLSTIEIVKKNIKTKQIKHSVVKSDKNMYYFVLFRV